VVDAIAEEGDAHMISYAQNREDVRLARVFDAATGFYIDIGASDGVQASVTRHFYARGWRGINVEPREAPFAELQRARPRDVNVRAAVSDAAGTRVLHEPDPRAGTCATIHAAQADALGALGVPLTARVVEATTLATLCEAHAPEVIDFLSIDVEGHEREVIAGGDWRRWRPRVVVVEAVAPVTYEPTHEAWEPLLVDAGYLAAGFDGINRYYVREEDRDFVPLVSRPVSVRDGFEPYEYVEEIERLRRELTDLAGPTLARQALAAGEMGQMRAVWDEYESLRQEVVTLRTQLEDVERQLAAEEGLYEALAWVKPPVRRRLAPARIVRRWRERWPGAEMRLRQIAWRHPVAARWGRRVLGRFIR
jgi:FkbM family methyltransferase